LKDWGFIEMNREFTLLSVIDKFGTVKGKKALHKIIYFTNLQTEDFLYRWNNYGPYSEEVQQFYEDASIDNIIKVREESLGGSATQYNMSLDQSGKKMLEELANNKNINHDRILSAINSSYELLNGMSPREMELLASVHYVTTYDPNQDSRRIWEIIDKLKPESNFSLEEVEGFLTILCNNHLIQNK